MGSSEFDTPCTACGDLIDVTRRHLTVEVKFEEHDPPGHVVAIGYATALGIYHETCIPPALDPRLIELAGGAAS